MGDNSNFIDLLNEFKGLKDPKPFSCKIAFGISAIDGQGIILHVQDKEFLNSEFFDGSLLEDNITESKNIPTKAGFYSATLKVRSFQCNHPEDPVEYDETIWIEDVKTVIMDSNFKVDKIEPVIDPNKVIKKQPVNQFGKPLKPSGHGIIVDKSNATKTFPMRSREFPPYHELNE